MKKTFNYSNRKNPMQWIWLILNIMFTFLFLYLFIIAAIDGEILYPLLIPLLFTLIIVLMFINKMFLAKITITDTGIEYKSPFKKIKINKDKIQAIEIIKHRKRRTPKYYSIDEKPNLNFGRYFLIARGYFKPDSSSFLTYTPVKDSYITAEYRDELLSEMLKLKE